jgi:ectoine hydroxylase-related dioxygenase (phytanoyl-CoA dioxygenase family)
VAGQRHLPEAHINRWGYADLYAVSLPARAGSGVLFSAWTWHHSKHNRTARTRRAFIVSYQEATVPRGAISGTRTWSSGDAAAFSYGLGNAVNELSTTHIVDRRREYIRVGKWTRDKS